MKRYSPARILRTLSIAALFLALPGRRAVVSAADPEWNYWESKLPQGGLSIDVSRIIPERGPRSVLRFNFRTDAKCESVIGLGTFHIGLSYGAFQSSATAPEEWGVQVDDGPREQGPALSNLYMNAIEMVLPVSRTLVDAAKSGRLLHMWQAKTGIAPPPYLRHVELSLRGAAKPLERAEARCAETIKR